MVNSYFSNVTKESSQIYLILICLYCLVVTDCSSDEGIFRVPVPKPSVLSPNTYKKCSMCGYKILKEKLLENQGRLLCRLCDKTEKVEKHRDGARRGIKRCAEKMLEYSNKKYQPIEIGSTVLIKIPAVDKAPSDPLNLMGKVLDYRFDKYEVGTEHGILNTLMSRNSLQTCDCRFTADIPQEYYSLRQLAIKHSNTGGQGYKKCQCKSGCKNNHCACRRAKMKCNSRCHGSSTCTNKLQV